MLRANLKTRLLLLILAAFAPAFILYTVNAYEQRERQKENVREDLLRLIRVMKFSHLQSRADAGELLNGLSHLSGLKRPGREKCSVLTRDFLHSFPGYLTFGLADTQGNALCSTEPVMLAGNVSNSGFFREAMSSRRFGIGPYEITTNNRPYTLVGVPVFNEKEEMDSVLYAALDLSRFDMLPSATQLPYNTVIAVMDQSGLVLARYPDPQGWVGTRLPATAPITGKLKHAVSDEWAGDLMGADGVMRLFAHARIHRSGRQSVFMIVGVPMQAAYAEAEATFHNSILSLLMASLLVLWIAWMGSHYLVVRKMRSLIRTAEQIRRGDLQARSGVRNTHDEVGQLALALDSMADAIGTRVEALQRHSRDMLELKEMNDALQSCMTQDEVLAVVRQYAPRLFPDEPGTLYLLHVSGDYLESRVSWLNPVASREFLPNDCWAIRRGKTYRVEADSHEARCHHVNEPPPRAYACIPMLVQGELIGVLHLESDNARRLRDDRGVNEQSMVEAAAENIGLTIANLRLRERLESQAMRDGLTGLYNRRYMEETLARETRNAQRKKSDIAILMVDIDHFKRFNDTYGHAAGDALLRETGRMMQVRMRAGDLACRYGGEEFTIILPGTSIEHARTIAENLRLAARQLQIEIDGHTIGKVTISLGIASYPQHGDTWERVLHAADLALLEAKRTRDSVVACEADASSERRRWTGT